MKTGAQSTRAGALRVVPVGDELPDAGERDVLADHEGELQRQRARAFAEPLLAGQALDTGEDALEHADGVSEILDQMGSAPSLRAAAYLVYAGDYLQKPEEMVTKAFGASHASLVSSTRKLVQIQRAAREAIFEGEQRKQQTELVRKMLLAFSRDLRVVLLRLASRLQTLRYYAASKNACPEPLALESMQVFAPLAHRLGIGQIKWELEDLAFRFLQPQQYKSVAKLLDEKRAEREQGVEASRLRLASHLQSHGIEAEVHGRPKHIYSIWKKMNGKGLDFASVLDVRALRVIVADVSECYAALSQVHSMLQPVVDEFSDYIGRPKPNGYQSLHTVVLDESRRPVEIQIRTHTMHEHAEHGAAAHWVYKESGVKGYSGAVADAVTVDERLAEARKGVLRQLLAWERDLSVQGSDAAAGDAQADSADRIYVFTPQGAVVELTAPATPLDFAYAVHTELGHRCRGAKVDGSMVPLQSVLANGQTVELTVAKEGGPSMDWLNADLGYLQSSRAKTKVRAWFNARALAQTVARGREAVEKLLHRLGKTAVKLDDLASRLGFKQADALFEVVGKDEFSLRTIETLLRPTEPAPSIDDSIAQRLSRPESAAPKGGVLVVGVESLLTTLSRCCRPAPPDTIGGYVTRGRGVAIHRRGCSNFVQMSQRSPERVIAVAWGEPSGNKGALYPVDVVVEASDRQGLLRDVSDVFSKERVNVIGVKTQSIKESLGGTAWMTFTLEVSDAARLTKVLNSVARIAGVRAVRRK
jgi:GTP pyrophosphokinase